LVTGLIFLSLSVVSSMYFVAFSMYLYMYDSASWLVWCSQHSIL